MGRKDCGHREVRAGLSMRLTPGPERAETGPDGSPLGSSAGRAAHRPVCALSQLCGWRRGTYGWAVSAVQAGPSADLSRAAFFRPGLSLQTGAPRGPWDPVRRAQSPGVGGSCLSSQPLEDGVGPPLPLSWAGQPAATPSPPGGVHSCSNLAPLDPRAQGGGGGWPRQRFPRRKLRERNEDVQPTGSVHASARGGQAVSP